MVRGHGHVWCGFRRRIRPELAPLSEFTPPLGPSQDCITARATARTLQSRYTPCSFSHTWLAPARTMDLFGSKTPAQRLKEYQRGIKKSVREMDRERTTLERNEKKLMAEIKKAAKDGHMDAAKIKAKDLVRTRSYIKKMFKMKSHMEAISLRLTTMQSSAQMAQSMKGITKIMGKMNAKMNLPQIQKVPPSATAAAAAHFPRSPPLGSAVLLVSRPADALDRAVCTQIMQDFEQQNEMMGMKEEMMEDAMDDAFAEDEDEDEVRPRACARGTQAVSLERKPRHRSLCPRPSLSLPPARPSLWRGFARGT